MEERLAAEKAGVRVEAAPSEPSQAERIRVNDRRRRFGFDEDEEQQDTAATEGRSAQEARNLKPTYVEELEARTLAAEQKTLDVQARFEQVRSDLQRETNETRQRLNRAADERASREKANFVGALLPVVDNLRRGLDAAEAGGSLDALLDGLRGTLSGFESALAGAGIESVEANGEQFDPELHEAVDTIAVEPSRDGMITAQYSRGYRLGNQLLRPARVQVGRASAATATTTNSAE